MYRNLSHREKAFSGIVLLLALRALDDIVILSSSIFSLYISGKRGILACASHSDIGWIGMGWEGKAASHSLHRSAGFEDV